MTPRDTDTHADISAELLEDSSSLSSTEDEVNELPTPTGVTHPKGFKGCDLESINLVEAPKKLTEVWLEDFLEATNDCNWSDADQAKWFFWFLTGPAKSAWQRTLKSE